MANRERGEISFEADGQVWTLRVDTNAMCEIEDLTGKGVAEISKLLGSEKTATISLLRAVFCGALRSRHADVTAKRAGELIDAIGVQSAGEMIGEAFNLAFPETKGKGNRPPVATAA